MTIYKNLLKESNDKIRTGRKLITIDCNDSSGDLEKFLMWWKFMGDIGHSALIHCDVDNKLDIVKIYCDGDGADRTYSINIKMLPDKK